MKLEKAFISFFLVLVCFVTSAHAQDVEVNATLNETAVLQGDRVILTVSVSGRKFKNVSPPALPNLTGLNYLSTNPSTSTNFSFVNGVSKSTYSYSYYIITEKIGQYTIPEVQVQIDNVVYKTKPLKLSVASRTANPKSVDTTPDIFLKMEVSNEQPYAGEQVIATVVLYFKNNLEILSYQPLAGWKAEGFWKEELNDGKQPKAESAILNGMSYRKAELVKYALFPTKTGKLSLSPFSVVTTVRVQSRSRDPFSSFFGGFGTNQRNIDLETPEKEVKVKALPELNNAVFSGAVGSFSIKRSVSKQELLVGESIEVSTSVNGSGNIALIAKPEYSYPNTFEIYDPQESSSINRRGDIIEGQKKFSDIVIPRTPGMFEVPETKMAYFNPIKKRYETTVLPAIRLSVKKDPRAIASTNQAIPFEVQPILGLVNWIRPQEELIHTEWWFISLLVMPLFTAVGLYGYRNYLDKMSGDVRFARSNKASKKADKRLQEAKKLAQSDIKASYADMYNALVGYIADRAHLPETGESDDIYLDELRHRNLEQEHIDILSQLMQKCSTIRFAPMTSIEDFEADLKTASELLKQIRRVV